MAVRIRARDSTMDCGNSSGRAHVVIQYKAVSGTVILLMISIPNILVIMLILRDLYKSGKVNVPRILVLCLAFSDFSYGACSTLPQVIDYWAGYCKAGGQPVCVFRGVMSNLASVSSTLIVVTMATERVVALKMPFRYERMITLRRTIALMFAILAYSMFIASLPLMGVNQYGYRGFCDFHWSDSSTIGGGYTIFRALQGLILTPVLLIGNLVVALELWRMRGRIHSEGSEGTSSHTRLVVLVTLISCSFIICNVPYLVCLLQHQSQMHMSRAQVIHVKRNYLANSIVNPIFFLIFYVTGRGKLRRLFTGCFKREEEATTETGKSQVAPVVTVNESIVT